MYSKKVLDLGCGYGDIGGALYRLGADITAVDARQEHLKIVSKKFPGIKVVRADLDQGWPFGQDFDLILDLGLLCHLADYESHLRAVCASTTHLVLETSVSDSPDPNRNGKILENKAIYDVSANGMGCSPSAAAIEKVLSQCGMNFKRMDSAKFNAGDLRYDWIPRNDGSYDNNKRRIWFCTNPRAGVHLPTAPLASPIITSTPTLQPILDLTPFQGIYQPNISHPIFNMSFASAISPPNNNLNSDTKRFVIVIPSYNNQQWCEQNISSALNQNYDQFRIIFTDDNSTDNTFDRVANVVNASPNANKCTLLKNTSRKGALQNLYNMITSCADDEIILTLDGDDWFPDNTVLSRLNSFYTQEDIWMTYGQYKNSNDGAHGVAQPYPGHIIETNGFRQHAWGASHLRTFYAWLFKKINRSDLLYNGEFFSMTWDFAIMFPMLEMSGYHSKFLSDILYVYNLDNPINDHKVNGQLQQTLDRHIRGLPKYNRVDRPPPVKKPPPPQKTNVGLMLIATGKYTRFLQGIISSADKYFLDPTYDVTYYVMSDAQNVIQSQRSVVQIPIQHRPFPFASMDRFKHFINNAALLSNENFLYYVDVDCLFVDRVGTEILGNLVGVKHCGYIGQSGPYENNPQSVLYVNNSYPNKYKYYFGGGFSGGRKDTYLELSRWCSEKIDQDVANGIIPRWHDETAINRYFLDHEPDVILSPSYHFPQSHPDHYKQFWSPTVFPPKIMLLDKNHSEVRA